MLKRVHDEPTQAEMLAVLSGHFDTTDTYEIFLAAACAFMNRVPGHKASESSAKAIEKGVHEYVDAYEERGAFPFFLPIVYKWITDSEGSPA